MNVQYFERGYDVSVQSGRISRSAGVVTLLIVVLTSGCSSFQEIYGRQPAATTAPNSQAPADEPFKREADTAESTRADGSDAPRRSKPSVQLARAEPLPAANHFIVQARAASDQGNYPQALSLLERARRISPGAGEVYREIAEVHMTMGESDQAKQFCYKAQSLSGDDAEFQERIRRVLNQLGSA